MKYLVLGAGLMGYACVFDLVKSTGVTKVTVLDVNQKHLNKIEENIKSSLLTCLNQDIQDKEALFALMNAHDTVISMISYRYNYDLTKMAIEANCNFCDLGGNNTIVDKQYTLDQLAKDKGVIVIPDCGLAPGLAGNIATLIVQKFDQAEHVKIRVGGLPVDPKPPMNYSIFFSAEGLINEYYEVPILLRDHKLVEGEPLGDLESLSFDNFPELEAFNTSGGISTLPRTISKYVKNLDYKTIRYKGHRDQCKLLLDLGLMDYEMIDVAGKNVSPRQVLVNNLYKTLTVGAKDVILLRVEGTGIKNGEDKTYSCEIIDYYDEKNNISAMMRMTSYPISVIAQMMTNNEIDQKGVVASELVVDNYKLLEELKNRDVNIKLY